ncbi:MAG: FtsK/SpoIIIE domain-containing protein [Pseudobdellovibrionaceae bacterium]
MSEQQNEQFWKEKLNNITRISWFAIAELIQGFRKGTIPIFTYCLPGLFVALCLIAKFDYFAADVLGKSSLRLTRSTSLIATYLSLFSGFILWAFQRAHQRNYALSKLKEAFERAQLNHGAKFPSLIDDIAVDDYVRRLKIKNNGQPIDKWIAVKEMIATNLNISIIKMNYYEEDRSRIEIIYSLKSMLRSYPFPTDLKLPDGDIPIGVSYGGPIILNLHRLPHMLVAGETNCGKTNFLKTLSRVLVENNEDCEVHFLDYKESAEGLSLLSSFGGAHDRIHVFSNKEANTKHIVSLATTMDARLKELSELGAVNFDEYLRKRISVTKKSGKGDPTRQEKLRRMYIVIDEIAEVYAKGKDLSKGLADEARAALNRLTRQARSAGMHLVICTQYPSAQGLDTTVKNNLPGVLCFAQPNVAGSTAAIGNNRATMIDPDIKGRAIWKVGPKQEEVQTYLFQ